MSSYSADPCNLLYQLIYRGKKLGYKIPQMTFREYIEKLASHFGCEATDEAVLKHIKHEHQVRLKMRRLAVKSYKVKSYDIIEDALRLDKKNKKMIK